MAHDEEILAAEHALFDALTQGSGESLDRILTDDFLLIDLTGQRVSKANLTERVGSGLLHFESITPKPDEFLVRSFETVGVVTGRTEMRGRLGETSFETGSRYTHVYSENGAGWRFMTAQGTPLQG